MTQTQMTRQQILDMQDDRHRLLTTRVRELELEVVRLRSVMADVIKAHGYAGGTPIEIMSTPFTPTTLPKLIEKVERKTIERSVRQGMDISHHAACVAQELSIAAYEMARPSVLYRPVLSLDGDHWCALYGVNIQEGVAGFGKSPKEAMDAFDKAWGEVSK